MFIYNYYNGSFNSTDFEFVFTDCGYTVKIITYEQYFYLFFLFGAIPITLIPILCILLIFGCFLLLNIYNTIRFIKMKRKFEFEKKLLGANNLNINVNNFIEIKEDDFKINLKDVKDFDGKYFFYF